MTLSRTFIAVLLSTVLLGGCAMMAPAGGNGQPATPGIAAQTSMIALQTWLMVQQGKATDAGNTARANAAASIMTSLGSLRTEANCARRLQLANAVAGGLQAEFPTYQAELGLGANLATVLASGYPGCQ